MAEEYGVLRPQQTPGIPLERWAPGATGYVRGVTFDSRLVCPGDLYVGLPGTRTHGARFATNAVAAGAVAVVTDAEGAALAADCGVPVVVVADPRRAMAKMAAEVYGNPARGLTMSAVTGTNGKTSTVFLLQSALQALGRNVATIGTLGYRIGESDLPMGRTTITTPESPDLQALLAIMAERGADSVAMEVSSHALALHRVDAITFDVAGFTMLGQDHLEFHSDMENYSAAKFGLFLGGASRLAVVNIDDPWGRSLARLVKEDGHAALVTTSIDRPADYRVTQVERHSDGSSDVTLQHRGGHVRFSLTMLGDFNVRNALTALAMVGSLGLDVERAASGLRDAQVPGRMQRVGLGAGSPNVVVDFAHTPQAVAAALGSLPEGGARIVVLGAGGDRDSTKRGPMGAAAAAAADVVIVTDDNPRSELPQTIREEVLAGARLAGTNAEIIDGGERRAAIAMALSRARARDWVAILGKGHETGQEVAGVIQPFDDVSVVHEVWQEAHRCNE